VILKRGCLDKGVDPFWRIDLMVIVFEWNYLKGRVVGEDSRLHPSGCGAPTIPVYKMKLNLHGNGWQPVSSH
jgi:hypothetical protein